MDRSRRHNNDCEALDRWQYVEEDEVTARHAELFDGLDVDVDQM